MIDMPHNASVRDLDHDRYPFRTMGEPGILFDDAQLVIHLVFVLQRFPINAKPPFALPGSLDRPYPDLGNATQREAGLGPSLWRLVDELESMSIPASFVVERQALPSLGDIEPQLRDLRHSVVAGGEHAVHLHTNEMTPDDERRIIAASVGDLEQRLGRKVHGWRSPYCAQSPSTLDLLAEAGLSYVGDFACDDRPFEIRTDIAPMLAVPMNHFYSDLHFIYSCRQSIEEYVRNTIGAAEWLIQERKSSPSVLSLVVHPWIMGATHRASQFARMLSSLESLPGVKFMSGDRIHERCRR